LGGTTVLPRLWLTTRDTRHRDLDGVGASSSFLVLGVLAALGLVALLYATYRGPGLFADSKFYLGGARNLLDGRGYVLLSTTGKAEPITGWPPLYSLALAGLGALGVDLQQGARWLNAALFSASIFLTAAAIRHLTPGSGRAPLFGAFLMLASVDLLRAYGQVGSDALFILFGLLGLMLLGCYLERPEPVYLLGAGVASGMTCAARYAGAALLATGVVTLLLGRPGWQRRLWDATVFASVGCIPLGVVAVRNRCVAGRALGRVLAFHPVSGANLRVGLDTVWGWLVPDRFLPGSLAALIGEVRGFRWIAMAVTALAGAIVVLRSRRRTGISPGTSTNTARVSQLAPFWLPIIFLLVYTAFLLVAISFFDADIRLDARILAPAFMATVVTGVILVPRLLTATRHSRVAVAAAWCAAVLLGTSYSHAAVHWIRGAHANGLGYGSRFWRESDLLQKVRALPSGVPTYSNGADVVSLVTGRPTDGLPARFDVSTNHPNPRYPAEMAALGAQLRAGAVIVYLSRITGRLYYPSEPELRQRFELRTRAEARDGVILAEGP